MTALPRTEAEARRAVAAALERCPEQMRLLALLAEVAPHAWIGAGFVRNAVWDELHALPGPTPYGDIDVVLFDPADPSPAADQRLESTLAARAPRVPWSVHNLARMHTRNRDAPYASLAEGLAHWPETATALAVRQNAGTLEVLAPLGLADLFALIVRPTPAFLARLEVYRARVRAKRWTARWPRLRLANMGAENMD